MNGRLYAAVLSVALMGCKSEEKPADPPAEQTAAKCQCPEGTCACEPCKSGDTDACTCGTK